jgi:guanylate kinase
MILNISGPSGSGKTTLAKRLCELYQDSYSRLVPYTTRSPRPGEQESIDYWFINELEYKLYLNWQLTRKSESGLYGIKDEDLREYSTPFLLTTFPPSGVVKMRNLGLVVQPFFLLLSPCECKKRMELRGDDEITIIERLKKDDVEVSFERMVKILSNDTILIVNASNEPSNVVKDFFTLSQRLL